MYDSGDEHFNVQMFFFVVAGIVMDFTVIWSVEKNFYYRNIGHIEGSKIADLVSDIV